MKQIVAVLLVIVAIISLIIVAFTVNQVTEEEQRLKADLQYRSTLLAESLKETVEPNFINKSDIYLQSVVERFTDKERFAGLGIYDNKNKAIAASSTIPEATSAASVIVANSMDADKPNGDFAKFENRKMYFLAVPLHENKSVVGALLVAQNAGYIDDRLNEIWRNNLIRLFAQAFLLSFATLLLIRWIIFEPIRGLVETLKLIRMGGVEQPPKGLSSSFFFRPLVKEISNMRSSLLEARISASEEARLRLEKLDSPWTAQRLKEFIKDILKGRAILMVAKREPYLHTKDKGRISYSFHVDGMSTALDPIMRVCGGTFIAHGSGDADKLVVDRSSKIKVPPEDPKYTLKRVWLTDEEVRGFDYGFSGEGLRPLCHNVHTRPIFRHEDWEQYVIVNQKFADAILMEIKNQEKPIVFVQDHQLVLVPKMVKMQRPGAVIGIFWHIPWPSPESFSICPWKKEILDGMLSADFIGFQTQLYCNNFIETAGREVESLIDFEQFTVRRNNHTSAIKPFPISIAFPNGLNHVDYDYKLEGEKILKNLDIKTKYIGLGVERLDYTKGILEKLRAVEVFLTKNPIYKERFTYIQIAAPSRTEIKKYRDFAQEVEKEVERINSIFKINGWKPIVLLVKNFSHIEVQTFYKLANVCIVASLHDGMNLVAKEYVAARDDETGVLILSQFTGASRELTKAIIINPYNRQQIAEAIKTALEMKDSEQIKRMQNMREVVKNYNIYRWAAEIFKTFVNI